MPFYDESVINELVNQTDIVEILEHYLSMKKRGRNYFALCPFHNEKTPSFTISPDKQIFHCFGCGVGGNALRFVQLIENLSFPEAIEKLAELSHFQLPASKHASSKTPSLKQINEWALEFFQKNLNKNQSKLSSWFEKRKIQPLTKEIFRLGYALPEWGALYQQAQKDKININLLVELGLVIRGKNNQYYDRFRNRIMFPIIDKSGKTIAFGGRTLDPDDKAKYLNSPESSLFHKGDQFFGLHQGKNAIFDKKTVFLVEGYMDLISLYQKGVKNCLSPLGTALTLKQSRILTRMADEIILFFDHDAAGLKAAFRATELLLPSGTKTSVILTETGMDPDDLITKKGMDYFKETVKKRENALFFRWKYLSENSGLKDPIQKINQMLSFIKYIDDPIIKDRYLDEISQLISIRKSVLMEKIDLDNDKKKFKGGAIQTGKSIKKEKILTEEKTLLQLILHHPQPFIELTKKRVPLILIQHETVRNILQSIYDHYLLNDNAEKPNWAALFSEKEEGSLITEILIHDFEDDHYETIFNDCVKKLKLRYLETSLKEVQYKIKISENQNNQTNLAHLLQRFEQLMKKKRELRS